MEVQRLVVPTVRRMKTKLALMGESEVGKTSLIRRFVRNEYEDAFLWYSATAFTAVITPRGSQASIEASAWEQE